MQQFKKLGFFIYFGYVIRNRVVVIDHANCQYDKGKV